MALGRSLGLLSFLLGLVACAHSSDEEAHPKFTPIGSGGYYDQYDSYGGEAGEDWGGNAGSDLGGAAGGDFGGAAGSDFGGAAGSGEDPDPGVGGSDPGTAGTTNAPGCGADGNACCATGDTCSDPKAQCCSECSGAPYYTCHCANEYHDPGLCRVCCVVCNNGKVKPDPLYVSASSCGDAANAWCKEHYNVGADPKSGWRAKCG